MDWNIWSSSYDQDVHDDNNFEQPGSPGGYHFDYRRDVIEEEALNEKYIIQVLKILIPNADAEIEERKMELLSLQNVLQPEPKKWLEICCRALSEKINQLDRSIRSLKNEGPEATEVQQQSHKPAETLEELLKALQRDYSQDVYKQLSDVDIKERCKDASRDATEANPMPTARGTIQCSVLTPKEKAPDSSKSDKELLTKKLGRSDLDTAVIRHQRGQSDMVKILEMPDKNVPKNDEVSKSQGITSDRGRVLNLFPSNKEAKQENAVVKDVNANAFGLETGIKARKECLGSERNALQQGSSENLNLDLELCSLAPKSPARDGKLSDEEKPHEIDLKPEIFANICNSNTSLPLKTDRKRKPELETFGDREPSDNPMEVTLDSSSKVASKWQRKSSTGIAGAGLNQPLNGEITQRAVQPSQHEVNKPRIVPFVSKNAISESQKKIEVSDLPITANLKNSTVNMDLPSSDKVATGNGNLKHPQVGRSYSIGSHNQKTSALPRSEVSSLEFMTVKELKAIAKRLNMRGYSKLTKAAFIDALKPLLDDSV